MTIPDWKFEFNNLMNWTVKKFNNSANPDWATPVSNTRKNLEKEIGDGVVTSNNVLGYQYEDDKELTVN